MGPSQVRPAHNLFNMLQRAQGIAVDSALARYRATSPALPLSESDNTPAAVAILRAAEAVLSDIRGCVNLDSSSDLPAERMGALLRVVLEHAPDIAQWPQTPWLYELYQAPDLWSTKALQACLSSQLRTATDGLAGRYPEASSGRAARLQLKTYVVDGNFALVLTLQEGSRFIQREYIAQFGLVNMSRCTACTIGKLFDKLRDWGVSLAEELFADYAAGVLFTSSPKTEFEAANRAAAIIAESLSPSLREALRNNLNLLAEKL